MRSFKIFAIIAASTTVLAAGVVLSTSAVAAGPQTVEVDTLSELQGALDTNCGDGNTVKVTANISEPTETVAVDCVDITFDINGKKVALQSLEINSNGSSSIIDNRIFTVQDSTGNTNQSNSFLKVEAPANKAGILNAQSMLVVESGVVIAKGGEGAAGIGGEPFANDFSNSSWQDGGQVQINGGQVIATGGEGAAGIGGAAWSNNASGPGGYFTITGGHVIVTAGEDAAAIGGGNSGSAEKIFFHGGVTELFGTTANAFGGGLDGDNQSQPIYMPIEIGDGTNDAVVYVETSDFDLWILSEDDVTGVAQVDIKNHGILAGPKDDPTEFPDVITSGGTDNVIIDNGGTIAWNEDILNEDIMVRGNNFYVDFDANGGSAVDPEYVFARTLESAYRDWPITTTRSGYQFMGWQASSFMPAGVSPNENTMITGSSNLRLFASTSTTGTPSDLDLVAVWSGSGSGSGNDLPGTGSPIPPGIVFAAMIASGVGVITLRKYLLN